MSESHPTKKKSADTRSFDEKYGALCARGDDRRSRGKAKGAVAEVPERKAPKTPTLAEQINAAHEAGILSVMTGLEHFKRTGDLLIKAKADQKHGKWQEWAKANLKFELRQAQKYMRLAEEWERVVELQKRTGSALLSLNKAVALLAESHAQDEEEQQVEPEQTTETAARSHNDTADEPPAEPGALEPVGAQDREDRPGDAPAPAVGQSAPAQDARDDGTDDAMTAGNLLKYGREVVGKFRGVVEQLPLKPVPLVTCPTCGGAGKVGEVEA